MAAGVETSGGSAGNTIAGIASLGGRAAYIGKVAADQLGEVFAHDMRAIGAAYDTAPLNGGAPTARCMISSFLGGMAPCPVILAAMRADLARLQGPRTARYGYSASVVRPPFSTTHL
jgi:sugar/nucleoside kinase (ribokinase family)